MLGVRPGRGSNRSFKQNGGTWGYANADPLNFFSSYPGDPYKLSLILEKPNIMAIVLVLARSYPIDNQVCRLAGGLHAASSSGLPSLCCKKLLSRSLTKRQ